MTGRFFGASSPAQAALPPTALDHRALACGQFTLPVSGYFLLVQKVSKNTPACGWSAYNFDLFYATARF